MRHTLQQAREGVDIGVGWRVEGVRAEGVGSAESCVISHHFTFALVRDLSLTAGMNQSQLWCVPA